MKTGLPFGIVAVLWFVSPMRKPGFDVLAVRLLIGLLLAWRTAVAIADDWPEFRGPTGQGLSNATSLPVKWDLQANVRWKVPVPGKGWSSPIVDDGRIFLTTAVPSDEDPPKRKAPKGVRRDSRRTPISTIITKNEIIRDLAIGSSSPERESVAAKATLSAGNDLAACCGTTIERLRDGRGHR